MADAIFGYGVEVDSEEFDIWDADDLVASDEYPGLVVVSVKELDEYEDTIVRRFVLLAESTFYSGGTSPAVQSYGNERELDTTSIDQFREDNSLASNPRWWFLDAWTLLDNRLVRV